MQQDIRFIVANEDLQIVFSCSNYAQRIREALSNLQISDTSPQNKGKINSIFSGSKEVVFTFDGESIKGECHRQAVFFENTDYPIYAHAINGKSITDLTLSLSHHEINDTELKDVIRSDEGVLYGAINFKNQVGLVDFMFSYKIKGVIKTLAFTTEVLSFKMDYRSDMKAIIREIEEEYAMLSYSFLKQTYLTFRTKQGQSTELIWWQIFLGCYNEIIKATNIIINTPKKRLKSAIRYERAERLPFINPEIENEYIEFKNEPNHRYRIEELFLSKDTIENRFLKYVVHEINRRFNIIRKHIKNSLNVNDSKINSEIKVMEEALLGLQNHPFFRGIGTFKGFSQDSLVMKQARGYKDILRCWIELQCGYELEDGIRRLEVKDISDLYEIWCFIKVKNIVAQILGQDTSVTTSGKELTSGFIRQLVYGNQSDVVFYKGSIELATVQYNAQVEEEENLKAESAIADTDSLTTIQRPDIVLRLSKEGETIRYTYLFDAKYRIADIKKNGLEVPPVDAINQMHRYRDAIYYTKSPDDKLKKEIIAGYVLYPGNINAHQYEDSYFKTSAEKIGIGAIPLKPGTKIIGPDGSLIIDPNSSEIILRKQIEKWINEDNPRLNLLYKSIPQKGLFYTDIEPKEGIVLFISPDTQVNEDDVLKGLKEDNAKIMYGGQQTHTRIKDLTSLQYVIVVNNGEYHGWYKVKKAELVNKEHVEQPMRIKFTFERFEPFPEKRISCKFGGILSAGVTYSVKKIREFRKEWRIE